MGTFALIDDNKARYEIKGDHIVIQYKELTDYHKREYDWVTKSKVMLNDEQAVAKLLRDLYHCGQRNGRDEYKIELKRQFSTLREFFD